MRDDAMMIRISVKTTRMYRMDEYTKRQLSNQWRLNFFYFDFLEFIFYLNISNFHFL